MHMIYEIIVAVVADLICGLIRKWLDRDK